MAKRKKEATVRLSYTSIDDAIKELKRLKKEGYTRLDGIDCDCWHSMCDADSCCFTSCSCGTFKVTE